MISKINAESAHKKHELQTAFLIYPRGTQLQNSSVPTWDTIVMSIFVYV